MGALSASVVAPATSANLGCAFDCAGIALNLYLHAQATVTDSPGLVVSYKGVDDAEIPTDESNLVVQAMHHAVAGSLPTLPGQDAFGAVQEIVRILEEDPDTDWSTVDLDALREHLIDMNEITLHADVRVTRIAGGISATVAQLVAAVEMN